MRRLMLGALVVLGACKTTEPMPAETKPAETTTPAPAPVAPPPPPMPAGLDESAMNPQVNPCDDFYQYACGNWLAKTEIPADRSAWSRGFIEIAVRNEKVMHDLLEQIRAGKAPEGTPYADKLADYYGTCMDERNLENSIPELQKWVNEIATVTDVKSLEKVVAHMHQVGVTPFFSFGSTQDFKDATQVTGEVDQAGLTLPDRDYYLKDDPKMVELRANYKQHLATVFKMLGHADAEAEQKAGHVLEVETELAKLSLSRVDRRDPAKLYHRLERAGLKKAAPKFPWDDYFKALGAPSVQKINVTHVPFVQGMNAMFAKMKPEVIRSYLKWQITNSAIPALPKRFQAEDFAFTSKNLTGAKEDRPRWKKCVQFTDNALGFALAVPFVKQTFGANSKDLTQAMVKQLEEVYSKEIDGLAWMDAPTKAKAQEKLAAIVNKIGYPDQWRKYETLTTAKGAFLPNWQAADQFEIRRRLDKIGKPVDRLEWLMTPPTVNAYYNPPMNEIVFPAGILQPPFFDQQATSAVNFGSMGMVVGHELTHGFDDEGRQFDAQGNWKDWWTPASGKAFEERTACVKKQYDGYTAIDDLKVNGALTLGENTADLGGLKMAFKAMQAFEQKQPQTAEQKARFTPEQQFFLGFAQSWCSKYRPEAARVRAVTDPHSPPFLRVNGPLGNLPQFSEAFSCKEGAKMIRPAAERCEVW